ncbi:MAG: hypothetical protein P4M00_21795 [Azospirillaceae bacterium]|nr:hypothetical protein [Azospirillaceae bacterium]
MAHVENGTRVSQTPNVCHPLRCQRHFHENDICLTVVDNENSRLTKYVAISEWGINPGMPCDTTSGHFITPPRIRTQKSEMAAENKIKSSLLILYLMSQLPTATPSLVRNVDLPIDTVNTNKWMG